MAPLARLTTHGQGPDRTAPAAAGAGDDRPVRRLRSAWVAFTGTYGALAVAALVLVALLRDGTAVTYAVALVSFWWLLPALPLLLASLLLRTWRTAALLAVPALVWGVVHGPPLFPDRGGPVDLRVATFNIEPGTRVDHVAALAASARPDVLLLQEVSEGARGELARALPDHPHRWFAAVPDPSDEAGGTAVLSRYPITAVEEVRGLPEGARAAAVVTLDVDGRALHVLSLHLASPCLACSAASARANPGGATDDAARTRVAEARRYAEVVAPLVTEGAAVVVAGDMNSSELNQPVPLLLATGLVDVHRAVGTGPGLTRQPGPGLARIDVVLVAGLRPVATSEGEAGRSSHSPVIADLAW